MSLFGTVFTVMRKELKDLSRDRRTLAALGPSVDHHPRRQAHRLGRPDIPPAGIGGLGPHMRVTLRRLGGVGQRGGIDQPWRHQALRAAAMKRRTLSGSFTAGRASTPEATSTA